MSLKVVLQFVVIALVFTMFRTQQAWGEKDCHGEKILVKEKCMESIKLVGDYVHPNQSCIHAVKDSDMTCICGIITLDDELEISVSKTLRLARECHNPVPAETKCGTFTVPPTGANI
ncbi:hypothetical protein EJB05_31940 [Eragrostis curvula]|uniref:Bifunctional inhibitor/plant lipid transfer protein/seed storage helical domain-containing protein n=1 Tax=Eragrostis curvula TaxID=38414 RepID=A0A5J9UFE4_9POAL|nr:hypothetical protein EJB05_31940 [Eragrostis curvula]